MNPFADHSEFMTACDQTVGVHNPKQMLLYLALIEEELAELKLAMDNGDTVETLDGILDVLVTTIGCGLSRFSSSQIEGAWGEVFASNMSKLDPETKRAIKRHDGKVLKGPAYFKPDLGRFV